MFKLIKILIVLAAVAALAYFAVFVKLGELTLWEHVVGISRTDEAQGLKTELESKATEIKRDVVEQVPVLKEGKGDRTAPLSELTDEDRAALIELLKEKNK
jgi:hypothetical protein